MACFHDTTYYVVVMKSPGHDFISDISLILWLNKMAMRAKVQVILELLISALHNASKYQNNAGNFNQIILHHQTPPFQGDSDGVVVQ